MTIWNKVSTVNFPIMYDCYIKIGSVIAKAQVHSACMKKGVFFNIVCPVSGKITAKKIKTDYFSTIENFENTVNGETKKYVDAEALLKCVYSLYERCQSPKQYDYSLFMIARDPELSNIFMNCLDVFREEIKELVMYGVPNPTQQWR